MHICLVSLDFQPFRSSGLTIYAEDLARGLNEQGHQVTVFAAQKPSLPTQHWVNGVEVLRVPLGSLDWFTYGGNVARALRELEQRRAFDIVHFLDVHFAYSYHSPFVASIWQSFHQRLTAHQGGPYCTGSVDWLRRQLYYRFAEICLERPSLSRAARLIASCQSTRNEFIRQYHVAPGRIDLAVQGIDTNLFQRVEAAALRRKLGLEHCRVLLFLGFITSRKGLEYLARAMQWLPQDAHLLIGGRWAGHYRQIFRRAAEPVADRVHEIGFLADEERPVYYSLADVYVSPSLLEGLGITPIEALACETPAVVTSATSGPEEVAEGGIVVPPCNPQALAVGIRTLLDDNHRRAQL